MTTFAIDNDNTITAFGSAAETSTTPFDSFASSKELAGLVAGWPADRLIAIWNDLPGVEPVKTFKSAKTATSRIWERIQGLAETAKPAAESTKPRAERKAKGRTCCQGRARQGQYDQEVHRRQERAQG